MQYMYSVVRWRVMCAPLTTTHFPTKPFISVSFFLLEFYNFRRYFETLECENKKKKVDWTDDGLCGKWIRLKANLWFVKRTSEMMLNII